MLSSDREGVGGMNSRRFGWSGRMLVADGRMRIAGLLLALLVVALTLRTALAQDKSADEDAGFGPVVSAYLGYLRNEQEVVDDRVSRREISRGYYRRNSNRIRALREMAIRIARESKNDYLPELEAVASDELSTLFEHPPHPVNLHAGEVLNYTFRYLGVVRTGETFYLFARLDPYEQTELRQKAAVTGKSAQESGKSTNVRALKTRPRRVLDPPQH